AHRRQGVARALLATAEGYCREAGYAKIVLDTSELQAAAITLYAASGYRRLRSEIAAAPSHRRVGIGLRQTFFEKDLAAAARA
ncbi:MAG: GNAT family N-acetyltransferase, partial [Burkholderiales bacterium]|nr:GNAT family N-acetyltransferase [Burkholderiales bacterium]